MLLIMIVLVDFFLIVKTMELGGHNSNWFKYFLQTMMNHKKIIIQTV